MILLLDLWIPSADLQVVMQAVPLGNDDVWVIFDFGEMFKKGIGGITAAGRFADVNDRAIWDLAVPEFAGTRNRFVAVGGPRNKEDVGERIFANGGKGVEFLDRKKVLDFGMTVVPFAVVGGDDADSVVGKRAGEPTAPRHDFEDLAGANPSGELARPLLVNDCPHAARGAFIARVIHCKRSIVFVSARARDCRRRGRDLV